MTRLLTIGMLGLFGATLVGCEASGRVGDSDRDTTRRVEIERDDDRYYEKTTVKTDDGQRSIETEVETD